MKPVPTKKSLFKKQIPTLLGLGILVVGLVVGIAFLGVGPGVFAPRATPQTTPKKIKLTNVTDSSFTVSFLTDDSVIGFVKYGTEVNSLKSQSGDDRDQLSGTVGEYRLHHVTVRGLSPNTNYYYVLGTGASSTFDNGGQPFAIKTTQRSGAPSAAKTAYGNVMTQSGNPANGAIVYLSVDGVGDMSSLVKSSGSWAVSLSNARQKDGSGYAEINDTDALNILVQGESANLQSNLSLTVADTQPVAEITLGQDGVEVVTNNVGNLDNDYDVPELTENLQDDYESQYDEVATVSADYGYTDYQVGDAIVGGGLGEIPESESIGGATEVEIVDTVDLNVVTPQTVNTSNPVIKGKLHPNLKIQVEINSDTQIIQEVTADANGNFEIDIEQLKQELEPGDHTVTYTYIDPDTGEEVSQTVSFVVEDPVEQLALADTSDPVTPYGSGNPYTIEESTQSADTTEASESAESSESAEVSTRSAMPATDSAVPVSGSVETTMALVLGGLFFIMAGGWSYYLATQIDPEQI